MVEQSAARGAVLKRQLVIAQQEGQDMGVAAAAAAADAAFLQAQLGDNSSDLVGCETDSDGCLSWVSFPGLMRIRHGLLWDLQLFEPSLLCQDGCIGCQGRPYPS